MLILNAVLMLFLAIAANYILWGSYIDYRTYYLNERKYKGKGAARLYRFRLTKTIAASFTISLFCACAIYASFAT